MNITHSGRDILISEFGELPPKGYQLKTTMEINILANKYSFMHNNPIEKKRKITYKHENAAELTIWLQGEAESYIAISKLNQAHKNI